MRALTIFFHKLLRNVRGATAVEYGLIIALVVLALIGSLNSVASTTTGMWNEISEKVQDAISSKKA